MLLREAALIEAAGHLFVQKGYEGTTIDDVIGAVGISKPTFYGHFASKEALAVRVIVSGLEKALARVEAFAAVLPPGEAARAMIEWAIDNQSGLDGEPSFTGALAFFGHDDVLAAESKLTERLADLINQGQQAGTIKKAAQPHILSRTFRSILKDDSFFNDLGGEKVSVANMKADIIAMLLGE
ncbi:TetR/AcrR family transcriptional regulator [Pleomorphomonas sp. PLEO]|uniref:TetR/AcrR family transcriptional regulator n=1 Tax=Pleomorphomonas sp. PLEO TaxID=3239306 RepID=UPI00351F6715